MAALWLPTKGIENVYSLRAFNAIADAAKNWNASNSDITIHHYVNRFWADIHQHEDCGCV